MIIDKRSDNTIEEVVNAAALLESYKIRIIPVALGREADVEELTNTTLDKNDLVKADKNGDSEKTAEEIIMRASKFVYTSLGFISSKGTQFLLSNAREKKSSCELALGIPCMITV